MSCDWGRYETGDENQGAVDRTAKSLAGKIGSVQKWCGNFNWQTEGGGNVVESLT